HGESRRAPRLGRRPGDARTGESVACLRGTRARRGSHRRLPRGAERLMSDAVLLLSGGLDSTTLLALALNEGCGVHAMTFRYGQRHASEIQAARRAAARYGVRDHVIVDIDLRTFGGSALTSNLPVPKDRDLAPGAAVGIPVTYVPA